MDTEKLLRDLFDFQRFERNEALQSVIEEAEAQGIGVELTDDELEQLSAAGDPFSSASDRIREDGLR